MINPIVKNTPIERYAKSSSYGKQIWVKREDLCCPNGPHLSKMRGIWPHIKHRQENLIGVLDTCRSLGGWGTSFCCKLLGKKCINFYPSYTKPRPEGVSQIEAIYHGATLHPLQAQRSIIMFSKARNLIEHQDGHMMPNAMKLIETVEYTAEEVLRTNTKKFDTIAIPIGTGTIASGILKGLEEKGETPLIILYLGYTRPKKAITRYISQYTNYPWKRIRIVDDGYQYMTPESRLPDFKTPFPASRHYEKKCINWLDQVPSTTLLGKILFWNIGI